MVFDTTGNLWAGTFRNGIGVVTRDGRLVRTIENETARYINFLGKGDDGIMAATSAGLLSFGNRTSAIRNITREGGLPSNAVTHFVDETISTAGGLAFKEDEAVRIISAVHGLPNNSVYSLLKVGNKLFAGTLGGLAEIEGQRVLRTYTDQNSGLTTNWVTAVYSVADRIFIGTYGGGIFELMPSGDIRSFENESGKFVVNFNALYSDGDRLYAGTLEGVRYLDLRSQQWKKFSGPLPSQTVMAVTGSEGAIYFGTSAGIAVLDKRHFSEDP